MQLYRTRSEAVIEASLPERKEIGSQLLGALRGDRITLDAGSRPRPWEHWTPAMTLTICIIHGRGFNAYWEGEAKLRVDVGESTVANFAEAFGFPPGAHVHYDPVAFPEETNDTSVELIIQDEPTTP